MFVGVGVGVVVEVACPVGEGVGVEDGIGVAVAAAPAIVIAAELEGMAAISSAVCLSVTIVRAGSKAKTIGVVVGV